MGVVLHRWGVNKVVGAIVTDHVLVPRFVAERRRLALYFFHTPVVIFSSLLPASHSLQSRLIHSIHSTMVTKSDLSEVELPNQWMLGRKLGEGAQGAVFAVNDKNNKETEWAVKLTKKPPKGKSKDHAEARMNAGSLHSEGLIYTAQLKKLHKTMVPDMPLDVSGVRTSGGFHFIIIERMECDLLGLMDEMATQKPAIDLGPIATRLIDIVEGIHQNLHLINDVKPENFMFARAKVAKKSKPSTMMQDYAGRLRAVDFGLMRPCEKPAMKGFLLGNAMYASLHMHTLHNSSRRDDLEMVCYVIGELLIRFQAMLDGTAERYESTRIPSYLPWSQEQSDEAVHQSKKQCVTDETSEFYTRMPKEAAKTLYKCLEEIWSYSFNKKPDYELLRTMVATLTVPHSPTAAKASKKKPPAKPRARRSAAKETIELASDDEDDDEVQIVESPDPSVRQLRSGRKIRTPGRASSASSEVDETPRKRKATAQRGQKRRAHPEDAIPMDVDEIVVDDDTDDAVEDVEMEIADETKENNPVSVKFTVCNQQTGRELSNFTITNDEVVVVGSKPAKSKNASLIVIPGSEPSHCKISLGIKRGRAVHAKVTDLKTKTGTFIGRDGTIVPNQIKKGGYAHCLIPGSILIGDGIKIKLSRA